MKFTRLRLQGFKSFVDATELTIAPGLTGVVGPNGCGKSNLLEAIRWVMGESSARAMRGDGMEDVIFAGAATRPARAFAEVALTLDNAARRAPVGFNETDLIEVSRRIARDLGSVYRVNGREARARDVRMLFADAATGAHSPALVRQGRISELVNARPAARRAILEEAAGVSGLHQRRHEAELKLDAAARNLAQVDDLADALGARLAQLDRQAREAARYRAIAAALRRAELALLVRRWTDAGAALDEADAALGAATAAAAGSARAALAAEQARDAAGDALPALREEAAIAAAVLQRLGIEREQAGARAREAAARAAQAAQRVAQIEADAAREAALNRDAGASLARLDAEAADLSRAGEGFEARLAAAQAEAEAAAATAAEGDAAYEAAADAAARMAARAEAAARRLVEAQAAADKARRAAEEAGAAASALAARIDALGTQAESGREGTAEAQARASLAEDETAAAEAARAEAQAREAEARIEAAEAEGARAALRAEVEGLRRALARAAGGTDQIIEAVRAAPGWEAALGAALGEDLSAPPAREGEGGWVALPSVAPGPVPAGAVPLAGAVEAPPALARRLDFTAVVDREAGDAAQGALAPGWRLVSREGDLWRWDGLRVRAGEASRVAAERLAQRNRLDAQAAALTAAEAQAAGAQAAQAAAKAALAAAAAREGAAREARRRADAAAAEAARAESRASAELELALGRLAALEAARDGRAADCEAADAALAAALAAQVEAGAPGEARAAADAARRAAEAARARAVAARGAVDELRRREAGREKRLGALARERAGWADRLAAAETRAADLDARLARALAEAREAAAAPGALAEAGAKLDAALRDAGARDRAARDGLAAAEAALRDAEAQAREAGRAAAEAREARARCEARREGEAERLSEAAARLAEAHPEGCEAARAALADSPLPAAEAAEIDAAKLRRQRDALGAVNLRAEEDAAEARTEREALLAEKADLEAAIARLRQGVAELNREGRQRLLGAFAAVDANFRGLFTHLFGGGEASLALIESDDPLEAGLEIMAMPPGKKLSTLSLLSGGEQTLTALALIFAVFLVNPAPICVLDEVDAPLDDANVGRFCDLLDEMTRRTETRFLVITHHAVTMSRMDRLFGVTMVEPGVSQLVSVDLVLAAEMATG